MTAFGQYELADLRRWAISAAVVLLAHGGIAAAMVGWREPVDPAEPAAAIVINFAPVPVAPAREQAEVAPGPEQVMADPSPKVEGREEKFEEKLEQKVEARLDTKVEERSEARPAEEPPPELTPAPDPQLSIEAPPPPQEVRQEAPQAREASLAAPATTAPHTMPAETAAVPAAPTQGQPNLKMSNAVQKWNMQMFALLKRNLRYPAAADRRGQTGVAQIFFNLDRQGRVIDSRIVRSSGVAALDEEALAVLRRVQPFPAPPPELTGERVGVNVPIGFNRK